MIYLYNVFTDKNCVVNNYLTLLDNLYAVFLLLRLIFISEMITKA